MTKLFDTQKLIHLRKDKLWTQEDLSAASGVSVRTIQRVERDGRISIESWKAIAAAFNIPPESLMAQDVNLSDPFETHATDRRRALIGVSLGCAGGLVGCFFAWWALFSAAPDFQSAVADYPFPTIYVTLATFACLMTPFWTWKKSL